MCPELTLKPATSRLLQVYFPTGAQNYIYRTRSQLALPSVAYRATPGSLYVSLRVRYHLSLRSPGKLTLPMPDLSQKFNNEGLTLNGVGGIFSSIGSSPDVSLSCVICTMYDVVLVVICGLRIVLVVKCHCGGNNNIYLIVCLDVL